jgi:protein-disulfide isomerase
VAAERAKVGDKAFIECISSSEARNIENNTRHNAQEYGVAKTPALFFNGRQMLLSQMLEADLILKNINQAIETR